MMGPGLRFRDMIAKYVPPWLSARLQAGKTAGYRFLWTLVAPLDTAGEFLMQGLLARFPGLGTASALPLIGRSRLLIRNQGESAEEYAARLIAWLDTHPEAGWEERTARAIHEFLSSKPRVAIVTRFGAWTNVATDGTVTRYTAAWDWDSVSHPERNDAEEPWWSDLWMIVWLPSQYPVRPGTLGDLTGDDGHALGHMVPHEDVDALKGLLAQWKGCHSRFRAVIFTTDETRFDPDEPSTMPDGTWGQWSLRGASSRVASGRDTTTTRYWEPR